MLEDTRPRPVAPDSFGVRGRATFASAGTAFDGEVPATFGFSDLGAKLRPLVFGPRRDVQHPARSVQVRRPASHQSDPLQALANKALLCLW